MKYDSLWWERMRNDLDRWFSNLSGCQNPLEALLAHRSLGPTPGWVFGRPRTCISSKMLMQLFQAPYPRPTGTNPQQCGASKPQPFLPHNAKELTGQRPVPYSFWDIKILNINYGLKTGIKIWFLCFHNHLLGILKDQQLKWSTGPSLCPLTPKTDNQKKGKIDY